MIARTGLRQDEAKEAGFDPFTIEAAAGITKPIIQALSLREIVVKHIESSGLEAGSDLLQMDPLFSGK